MLLPIAMGVVLALVAAPGTPLTVEPAELRLVGSDATAQLVATDENLRDATRETTSQSDDPAIASIDADGTVHARGEGRTTLRVRLGATEQIVPVVVEDFADARPLSFTSDVVPILTRHGCNSGGCHGKSVGQNGFRLSLLGFDPRMDWEVLVREGRGRRVFPAAPERSLILMKSTARIPHGGGKKFAADSPEARTIARWITQGATFDAGQGPTLVEIAVTPSARIVPPGREQQLRVAATYFDGAVRDVTRLARFQSNALDLATVDERGKLRTQDGVGEAAVLVRFGGKVAVARATVPLGRETPAWTMPESSNPIDPPVFRKLQALGLPPSGDATDAEFVRRVFLDVCGILPSPAEVARYEADGELAKREKLVDRLLQRPEYADFFALKWSTILRNQRRAVNVQLGGNSQAITYAFHGWVREAIAENRPYDQFAADLIAARGDPSVNPAVAWYRPRDFRVDEEKQLKEHADDTAQLFLGMRIQCAQCHHHPFETWSQEDYYGFASIFARVGTKPGVDVFSPKIFVKPEGKAKHPRTGKPLAPKALNGPEFSTLGPRDDPRVALVDWLRTPENPFFARAVVNRYWKHFFGRGVVEPEDDMRSSNPPTNPELLDTLSREFVAHHYDLKWLVRTIATSRAYGLSSLPNEFNDRDSQNFARFYPRRLPAEVLLDALAGVTLAPDRFAGMPRGFRAAQLPDEGFASTFLDVFGRPKRESVCECERTSEANLAQRLHLLNSGEIESKLGNTSGRVTGWASENDLRPDAIKVEELYRSCLARGPTDDEREICAAHLAKSRDAAKLKQGWEDLLWAMINTKEFLFNH